MFIQYSYAVLTMLPCPLWFYNRKLSAIFITFVGLMSIYNGATYYSKSCVTGFILPMLTVTQSMSSENDSRRNWKSFGKMPPSGRTLHLPRVRSSTEAPAWTTSRIWTRRIPIRRHLPQEMRRSAIRLI